jgi:hypothetical protein
MGSGFKNFTATVLTASDVNNYLMEQSVMSFASTGARDVQVTSPEDGMVAYIRSNDSSEGLYTYNGTAWRKGPGWNAPWGYIGRTELSVNTTGMTTGTDLTGGTLTFTAVANRLYRVESWVYLVAAAGTNSGLLSVLEGATNIILAGGPTNSTGIGAHIYGVRTTTFTAGSHTLKLRGAVLAGTGSVQTSIAVADRPDFIMVTDVGPAGTPT